jgi:hypothetical protein
MSDLMLFFSVQINEWIWLFLSRLMSDLGDCFLSRLMNGVFWFLLFKSINVFKNVQTLVSSHGVAKSSYFGQPLWHHFHVISWLGLAILRTSKPWIIMLPVLHLSPSAWALNLIVRDGALVAKWSPTHFSNISMLVFGDGVALVATKHLLWMSLLWEKSCKRCTGSKIIMYWFCKHNCVSIMGMVLHW